jgi:hypothetical protein
MLSRSSPITQRSRRVSSLPLAFTLACCIFLIDTLGIHYGDVVQGDIGSDKRLELATLSI